MGKYTTNILNELNRRELNRRLSSVRISNIGSRRELMPDLPLQQVQRFIAANSSIDKWKTYRRRHGSPPPTRPGVESMLADGAILTDMGKFIRSEVSHVLISMGFKAL